MEAGWSLPVAALMEGRELASASRRRQRGRDELAALFRRTRAASAGDAQPPARLPNGRAPRRG